MLNMFSFLSKNNVKRLQGGNKLLVQRLDLAGVDFVWRLIEECPAQDMALVDMAIDYLLDLRFFCVSQRLKADLEGLHTEFAGE